MTATPPASGTVTAEARSPRRAAAFDEADANLAEMLDSLAEATNYLDLQAGLVAPHLSGPVLEVGAGLGDLTERYRAAGHEVVATDISDRCLPHLERLAATDAGLRVGRYDLSRPGAAPHRPTDGFGSAVSSNVLEHLADDVAALRHLGDQVRPGGRVVAFVPAFEALYGRFDQQIGHHRRYRRATLEDAFRRAGLEPVLVRYVNLPGWFAWLLTVRILGRVPTGDGAVRSYDRFVVPAIQRIENRIEPPFGQSVLGVGRVPDEWVRPLGSRSRHRDG